MARWESIWHNASPNPFILIGYIFSFIIALKYLLFAVNDNIDWICFFTNELINVIWCVLSVSGCMMWMVMAGSTSVRWPDLWAAFTKCWDSISWYNRYLTKQYLSVIHLSTSYTGDCQWTSKIHIREDGYWLWRPRDQRGVHEELPGGWQHDEPAHAPGVSLE